MISHLASSDVSYSGLSEHSCDGRLGSLPLMWPVYEAAGVWTAGFHVSLPVGPLAPSLSLIKALPFSAPPTHHHHQSHLLLFLSSSSTSHPHRNLTDDYTCHSRQHVANYEDGEREGASRLAIKKGREARQFGSNFLFHSGRLLSSYPSREADIHFGSIFPERQKTQWPCLTLSWPLEHLSMFQGNHRLI